nr:pyrophosphate--fructose 6-phosphate 1-phosphotransferase subunit alpha-like isoform X2 [Ipomoea batatas]
MFKNRELEVDVKTLGNGFCQKCQNQLKEPHVCFYDADHVLKTEEVLFYVDKVKKITRPGCPPEVLDVALTSMSSLVKILSKMSSKPYPPSLL